jgi:CDP-glucose 4,6-dehydratase
MEGMDMNNFLSNFYKGKKVLITGHTGFKGSWLSNWLNILGADVYGYALKPESNSLFEKLQLDSLIHSHIDDIQNKDKIYNYIQDVKPDIVFHLAAQALVHKSYDEPHQTFSTNVMGAVNLLESIKDCQSVKSLVYITSDKCYWNSEWIWGYRESDPLGGADPYSASKACAEHVFKSYYLSYFKHRENFGCGSARAGNVIGGGDYSLNRIIPDIVRSIEAEKNIVLRHPNSTRPWQHVLDPLHGYLILAKHLYENPTIHNGEAWNFGPTNQSMKTVYELTKEFIVDFSDITIVVDESESKPYESTLLHLSIDKATALLNWRPNYNFYDTIAVTKAWYKNHLTNCDPIKTTQDQIVNFMKKISNG